MQKCIWASNVHSQNGCKQRGVTVKQNASEERGNAKMHTLSPQCNLSDGGWMCRLGGEQRSLTDLGPIGKVALVRVVVCMFLNDP
jgi:hypothetical protein